jgi:hypothetical protein
MPVFEAATVPEASEGVAAGLGFGFGERAEHREAVRGATRGDLEVLDVRFGWRYTVGSGCVGDSNGLACDADGDTGG